VRGAELDALDERVVLFEPVVELEVLLLLVAGHAVVAAPDVVVRVTSDRDVHGLADGRALPADDLGGKALGAQVSGLLGGSVDLEIAAAIGLHHVEAGQRELALVLRRRVHAVGVHRLTSRHGRGRDRGKREERRREDGASHAQLHTPS
jgi:hypothetical protein